MRCFVIAFVLALAASAQAQPGAATITIRGHVEAVMNGKAAKPPDGGLWVYLVDKDRHHKRTKDPAGQKIVQRNTEFDPHVLVVSKGTVIDFPNEDDLDHNVFSPDPFFDLDRYGPKKSKPKKFDALGEREIYCDIHKCMWARVKVVDVIDDSYIQQVKPDGTYEFHVATPSKYEVVAWAVASADVPSGSKSLATGDAWDVPTLHVQIGVLNLNHKNKSSQDYTNIYSGRCP